MSGLVMRPRTLALLLVAAVVGLLALANAQLVYVAIMSQPDCVAHHKAATSKPGAYRAAGSAC